MKNELRHTKMIKTCDGLGKNVAKKLFLKNFGFSVKFTENPSPDVNEIKIPGIGGAINFICKAFNDIYSNKEFADEWRKNIADKVKDNFDDYIIILRYLWNIVEKIRSIKLS